MKIKDLFKKVSVANEVGFNFDIKFCVKFEYDYMEKKFDSYKEFLKYVNSEFNEPWARVLRTNFEINKNINDSYDFNELIIDREWDVNQMFICKFTILRSY